MHTIPYDLKEQLYMSGVQSSNIWKGISSKSETEFYLKRQISCNQPNSEVVPFHSLKKTIFHLSTN